MKIAAIMTPIDMIISPRTCKYAASTLIFLLSGFFSSSCAFSSAFSSLPSPCE